MIAHSTTLKSVLAGSHDQYIRVESWLGNRLLASDVPVSSADEKTDRSRGVPEQISLRIPAWDRGKSWTPIADDSPLAANGQRLRVLLGIPVGNGAMEWLQRGWFVIQSAESDGFTVDVQAYGLLTWINEARFTTPYQPTGTFKSAIQDIIEPALTVQFSPALVDRAVPTALNFDESRIDALQEFLKAWSAQAYVTENGYLWVEPADDGTTPVLSLTDGVGGTVISVVGTSTREDAFNVVVARGATADGNVVQGVAYDTTGPKAYGSQFNRLAVPYFYESPLLTTNAQCTAAAKTRLATLKRQTAIAFDVTCIPYPALQVGDVVSLTTDIYSGLLCSVESFDLPYNPGGGEMRLVVRRLT